MEAYLHSVSRLILKIFIFNLNANWRRRNDYVFNDEVITVLHDSIRRYAVKTSTILAISDGSHSDALTPGSQPSRRWLNLKTAS